MGDIIAVISIVASVTIVLIGYSVLQMLHRIESRQKVQATHIASLLKSVSSTQSSLRQRMKSDGVEPIMDRPKAEQHYEGRGIKRVARGGKTDPAGGESTTARIGEVKRRSYGGTSGVPGSR